MGGMAAHFSPSIRSDERSPSGAIAAKARCATIVAVGDVHGELDALREILRHAELLGDQDQWVGRETVLVQTGDVIDRGPKSKEAYSLLARLQGEAPKTGGKVVRLLGNHELAILQGNTGYANFQGIAEFQRLLLQDVFAGNVRAAFAGEGYLFTHAGLRTELGKCLLGGATREPGRCDAEILAERLNHIFLEAVANRNYQHPIFDIGVSRGGARPSGGIFWEDASQIMPAARAGALPQVFGHTQYRKIQISPCASRVAIDVGIQPYGGRAYLAIRAGKPSAQNAGAEWPKANLVREAARSRASSHYMFRTA